MFESSDPDAFSEGIVHLQIYQNQIMHTVKFIIVLLSNTENTRYTFCSFIRSSCHASASSEAIHLFRAVNILAIYVSWPLAIWPSYLQKNETNK
jgi:hypothetical protein